MYVCGVSIGLRMEDWNTPDSAGGVRMGVGVGGMGVGVSVGVEAGGCGVNVAVGTGVSAAFGAILPHDVRNRIMIIPAIDNLNNCFTIVDISMLCIIL